MKSAKPRHLGVCDGRTTRDFAGCNRVPQNKHKLKAILERLYQIPTMLDPGLVCSFSQVVVLIDILQADGVAGATQGAAGLRVPATSNDDSEDPATTSEATLGIHGPAGTYVMWLFICTVSERRGKLVL